MSDCTLCLSRSSFRRETHIHAHYNRPGPVTYVNVQAYVLVSSSVLILSFQATQNSHELLQQNARSLQVQFSSPCEQAEQIIRVCPPCSSFTLQPSASAINPQGLKSNAIWQTDLTHIPEFGCLKCIHVTIDIFFLI